MEIEWDETKRVSNLRKHGLDFRDGDVLFGTQGGLVFGRDERFDYGESRYIGFGLLHGRLVVVCFVYRANRLRLVSLRRANDREKNRYKEKNQGGSK